MDKLNDFRYTMDSCNHCGQCKWILPHKMHGWDFAEICPIYQYYGFDACSGQGLINNAKEVLNGTVSFGDGLEDLLYTCTACGACDVNCKSVRDMEVLDTIYALRTDCAEKGALPESVKETGNNVINTHNIYGLPHEERWNWLPADCGETPDADTVLFLGCAASYQHKEIALAAIQILQKGGIPFRLLREDEWCCGAYLWRTGQMEAAEALVHRNIELLRAQGVKTLITACGECFGSFRSGYPRFEELPCEIRHISEVAAELVEQGKLKLHSASLPGPVTYHDPCMLGRQSEVYVPWEGKMKPYGLLDPPKVWRRGEHGVYDAPRKILQAIPELEYCEMPRNSEESYCCGAMAIDADFRTWTGAERRREAVQSGASAMVTACPFCLDALDSDQEGNLPCYDLSVLLANALEGGEQ
ncbi:MAG: (Fe-S)-binding protein [Lachnospiraceae bacterium]|nr:(Fe-S)-binding protein [Lachnospiraceae bacterium]